MLTSVSWTGHPNHTNDMKKVFFALMCLIGFTACSADFEDLQYNDTEDGLMVYQDEQPFTGNVSYCHGRVQMDVVNGVSQGVKFYNRRGNLSIVYHQQKTRSYYNEKGIQIDRAKYHHLYSKDLEEMTDLLYYVNTVVKKNPLHKPINALEIHNLSSTDR